QREYRSIPLIRLVSCLLLLCCLATAQTPVSIGKGCTTAFYIDKDCDGYGVAMRSDSDYGPGNVSGANYSTAKIGDLPDADDNDPTVNTVASWRTKYGSGPSDESLATLQAFLLASRGYNPSRVFFIDSTNGDNSTGVVNDITHPFHDSDFLNPTLSDGAGGAV